MENPTLTLTVTKKYNNQEKYYFTKFTKIGEVYNFKLPDSFFVFADSIIEFDIPGENFYFKTEKLKKTISITEVNYYSDIRIIDYPSNLVFNKCEWLKN